MYFLFLIIYFIYFWLHWVFVAVCGPSSRVMVVSYACGAWASHCGGFLCCGAQSRGIGLSSCIRSLSSYSVLAELLCGMWNLPGPGINPCPLHWQVDSYPLDHQ